MRIVIFAHPNFIGSQSMPRYVRMIAKGMEERDHQVDIWTPKPYVQRIPAPVFWKKWLKYFDQYIVFPLEVKLKLLPGCSKETLFVFADHALGPWIPLVSGRPLVVHCHDFLAQRSATGEIAENSVRFLGKIYQKIIRMGYIKAKYFISVSKKTRKDLHNFLGYSPAHSWVVYNGLHLNFKPADVFQVRKILSKQFSIDLTEGYILHVGGNQFYKNRRGVLKIYDAWREFYRKDVPLIMIGSLPTEELILHKNKSQFSASIYFLTNISDEDLKLFYQGAILLLFPSLEEGFGWPIAEALASGCPVVTTGRAPMNEVGGSCCYYIKRMPYDESLAKSWAKNSADTINDLVELPLEERNELINAGISYAKRFNSCTTLQRMESIYKEVYQLYQA